MSTRRTAVDEILTRYASGFFPLYDAAGNFYWERHFIRAVLPINPDTVRRARRLAQRSRKKFEIRYTTAVEAIIAALRDESIKENSWVKDEIAALYRALHAGGLLQTVEAWRDGKLEGALLGLVLPGTFIAETMFTLEPDASKVCLCQLVEDCAAQGFEMIDVQTPHDRRHLYGISFDEPIPNNIIPIESGYTPHPCIRLGEQHLPLIKFMANFASAWKRAFNGSVRDWARTAQNIKINPDAQADPRAKILLKNCAHAEPTQ